MRVNKTYFYKNYVPFSVKPILIQQQFVALARSLSYILTPFVSSNQLVVGTILRWDFFSFHFFFFFGSVCLHTLHIIIAAVAVRCGNIFHIVCIILRFLFLSKLSFFCFFLCKSRPCLNKFTIHRLLVHVSLVTWTLNVPALFIKEKKKKIKRRYTYLI